MKTAKTRAIFGAILICLLLSGVCYSFQPDAVLPEEVKLFAEEYINLLKEGNAEKVKELLHPEVKDEITDRDIENVVKCIGGEAAVKMDFQLLTFEESDFGAGYKLFIGVEYEESSQIIWMTIIDVEGEMKVVSVTVSSIGASSASLGSVGSGKLYEILKLPPPEPPSFKFPCAFLLVLLVFSIIQIVAMWRVYEKAGEAGWAVLIPIYNMYVLARVGDKPEWMGILAALSGFIPFVGPIIGIVLYIMISIGVANTFGKGILFGLGLFILPWIFYPILGFGSADAGGPAPDRRDFSGGAGQVFYAPPEPAADVAPPQAPIPMPADPISEKMFGPKPIPLEPEVPKKEFIRFTCSCGKRFKVPLKLGGKIGKCPQCQKRIKIPDK